MSYLTIHVPPLALADYCIDYRQFLHRTSFSFIPGSTTALGVDGAYAYVGGDDDWDRPNLRVIDITDSTSPEIVGEVDTPSRPLGIAIASGHVFLACGFSGLVVIDVSEPTDPAQVGSLPLLRPAADVGVAWDHAYVADGELQIIDVSDPSAPVAVGTAHVPASQVLARADYVYVARDSTVSILDIANPSSPVFLSSAFAYDRVMDFDVYGTKLQMAARRSGLVLYDISDPTSPVYLTSVPIPGETGYDETYDVDSRYARAFVLSAHPYVSGSTILSVVDITLATKAEIVGQLPMPDFSADTVVLHNHAYVLGPSSLMVLDTSNSLSPDPIGSLSNYTEIEDIEVEGNYAFAGNGYLGLRIVDVSDPETPTSVALLDLPAAPEIIELAGNYVFVGDRSDYGVYIIDVSTPKAPRLAETIDVGGFVGDIVVEGSLLYVTSGDRCGADLCYRLLEFKIGNPESPVLRRWFNAGEGRSRIAIQDGNYAWVGGGDQGLLGIRLRADVPDPGPVPYFDYRYAIRDLEMLGDALYAVTWDSVIVVDVSNVISPAIAASLGAGGNMIEMAGDVGYLATADRGMVVIETSTPTRPQLLGEFGLPRWVNSVAVGETEDVVFFGGYGFFLVGPGQCRAVTSVLGTGVPTPGPGLLAPWPNPSSDGTAIRFQLAAEQMLSLGVYDVAGRRVKQLLRGPRGPGTFTCMWDGRDEKGRVVASGVYFVRLETGSRTETRTVTRLR